MRRDIKPLAVAAEFFRVAPGPRDRAAHLLVHRHQIAAGLIDIDEIDDDGVRPGAHQRLGLQRVIGRLVAAPGAAVDETLTGAFGAARGKYRAARLAWAVGDALRRAEDRARPFARRNAARDNGIAVRRIDVLVVGVVELLLVHVEPDDRTLGLAARRPQ